MFIGFSNSSSKALHLVLSLRSSRWRWKTSRRKSSTLETRLCSIVFSRRNFLISSFKRRMSSMRDLVVIRINRGIRRPCPQTRWWQCKPSNRNVVLKPNSCHDPKIYEATSKVKQQQQHQQKHQQKQHQQQQRQKLHQPEDGMSLPLRPNVKIPFNSKERSRTLFPGPPSFLIPAG